MTLAEILPQSLSDLNTGGATTHIAGADDWRTEIALDRHDGLASVVRSLKLTRQAEAPAGATLAGWANGIATRVHGLLEDLKPIEVDATVNQAILRSEAPAVHGNVRSYYEVHLRGTEEATVQRFAADRAAGTKREAVGFTLTHEMLGKLVNDIATAASGS